MNLGGYKIIEKAKIPKVATRLSACFDLQACFHKPIVKGMNEYNQKVDLPVIDDYIVLPGLSRALIPTGLIFVIPDLYQMKINPRSGLAWKNGITVINSPGTIDSDYPDETFVLLWNTSKFDFTIGDGDRIAQGELMKNESYLTTFSKADVFDLNLLKNKSDRNGGMGSTGV